ncbi:MAG: MlaD family protein [Armatimonadota bacterium]|nr:MlaD family protein [Armatimonadota bacterium]MDR7532912.1 MlaD family protein [Armatimonadota bacterium]MDR7536119.1 MlaD family protein [Armatimonadota bacterium]
MTTEARVGLVAVVLFVAALLGAVVFLSGGVTELFEPRYVIRLRVGNAGGMVEGAPVQMAGVQIGEVRTIGLTPSGQAELVLRIRSRFAIPQGSRFAIATTGLLGERFVTISPGLPTAPPLPPESVVQGLDPFTVEDVITRVIAVARQAEDALGHVNRLIGDPELGQALAEAVRNTREATAVMRRVADTVDRMTRTLERMAGQDVPAVMAGVRATADDLAAAAHDMRALVADVAAGGQTAQQVRETVAAVQRAAQGIDRMVRDLQGVINEPQIRQVRVALGEAQAAVTEARQAVGEARALIQRADRVVERVNRVVPERLELPDLRTSYRLQYELWYTTRLGHDVMFTLLPDAPRRYIFTWRDVGMENRIGLQVGQWLQRPPVFLRYGLVDSQLGAGVDYGTPPGPVYSLDLSNLNRLTLNLYASYFLHRDYGITLRATDLLQSPTLGLGYFRRF